MNWHVLCILFHKREKQRTLAAEGHGERKQETEEKDKTFHRVERHYGSFRRILRLGADVDPGTIDANYKDGVLRITAPRTEATRPKRIEVHA